MNTLRFNAGSTAEIITFDSLESVALDTLSYLQHGTVGLSGGLTFAPLFPLWAQHIPDCSNASFFPVDERVVPFEDSESNWGNAFRLFLNPIGKSSDMAHAALSVDQYCNILKSNFATMPPVFDVIFLGMGTDGHTASLFPGTHHVLDPAISVLKTISPLPPVQRITLSIAALAAAKKVVVIIAGANKVTPTAEIFKKNEALPIVQVLSQRRDSIIYLEEAIYTESNKIG